MAKGAKKQAPSTAKPKKVKPPYTGPAINYTEKPMTLERAIQVLIGAGVHVNTKKNITVWTRGMKPSGKVLKAAHVIDSIMTIAVVDGKSQQVPVWSTKWVEFDAEADKRRKAKKAKKKAMIAAKKAAGIATKEAK